MARWWVHILDIGLTLWVLRGPLTAVLLGAAILLIAPQAQDLLVEPVMGGFQQPFLLAIGVIFIWAIPTHYAARLLVESDARYLRRIGTSQHGFRYCLSKWAPRLLGAAIFVILALAAWKSWSIVPDLARKSVSDDVKVRLLWLIAGFALLTVLFVVYTIVRPCIAASRPFRTLEAIATAVLQLIPARLRNCLSLNPARSAAGSALGPLLLLGLFVAFAGVPIFHPYTFAKWFPRAASVPFALGGWIPLVALLSGLGRRHRAPFVTIVLLVLAILPIFFHDFYRVPVVDAGKQAAEVMKGRSSGRIDSSALKLNDAVALWKSANKCDKPCPRPIIVAAAGGASRAGFFTASVLGQLLDGDLADGKSGRHVSGQALQNRLFAFSTVSGSSVAGVMVAAAMAQSGDGKQPCKGASDLWYRDGEAIDNWRSCLEALLAGDFLTPIFTGFVFHDVFRFIGWEDRGKLLEQSFEDRFKHVIGKPAAEPKDLGCIGDLACPSRTLRPNQARWLPILVLNSTSVGSGQRIITTVLDQRFQAVDDKCPLQPGLDHSVACPVFENANMLHGMLSEGGTPSPVDVKLSTAAHNSARFPFLSPPGDIRNSSGEFIDRIVDGGYFENLGVQTATELAEAITAVDKTLRPFVLVISNDPTLILTRKEMEQRPDVYGGARQASALQKNRRETGFFLTDIAAPLAAVANTRNARGVLALADIAAILDRHHPGLCNSAHIRVWGEPSLNDPGSAREVSWSWWLSSPVQQYLHEQTIPTDRPDFENENARSIRDVLRALADSGENANAVPCEAQ
jgi:hypothetical protein